MGYDIDRIHRLEGILDIRSFAIHM
jgi:hypothetical protein